MQVDKESNNSEYWYLLGKSQIYMEPEKALESFNKAIKLKTTLYSTLIKG
ncbi:hypothetical protein RAS_04390 [Rickettsia asiatica]|uniref:Tetratricopeptide repeat protein n=1 Tax=Rickettsia asiatica TaxID=238800 RepID=A0A510G6V5_9RICK|nr:hypothetical protein [Rickettsia asiatica]BBJ31330.1 hypothetical protein RAS_04390 [Rickettsia asiatica]